MEYIQGQPIADKIYSQVEKQLQQFVEIQNRAKEDYKVSEYYLDPFVGMAVRAQRERIWNHWFRYSLPTSAAIGPGVMAEAMVASLIERGGLPGDRVRMSDLSGDSGIFMRSMATRGFLGGLAQATENVVRAMDAFGKDIVIVETVGVGQDEVDVIRIADTVCLVLVPGMGDVIQSMKAGVMEIADIFVVNKADSDGADQVVMDIEGMLNLRPSEADRRPPVEPVRTSTPA